MLMWSEIRTGPNSGELLSRLGERGSGVVEWLGISALSIGLLVALFAAVESLGLDLIEAIRTQLGV